MSAVTDSSRMSPAVRPTNLAPSEKPPGTGKLSRELTIAAGYRAAGNSDRLSACAGRHLEGHGIDLSPNWCQCYAWATGGGRKTGTIGGSVCERRCFYFSSARARSEELASS